MFLAGDSALATRNNIWTQGGDSQVRKKGDHLTTLYVNNEAEKGEPQLQNKRGEKCFEPVMFGRCSGGAR
jgi:hypothetical protein